MFGERDEKGIRKVLRGDSVGYKWWEKAEEFIIINRESDYGSKKKLPRLFVFENGSIPEKSEGFVDGLFANKNFKISIRDDKEDLDRNLNISDSKTGLYSSWNLIGSYDPSLKQGKTLRAISNDVENHRNRNLREMLPDSTIAMKRRLKQMYCNGYFNFYTYNHLVSKTNPDKRFESEITVARDQGVYDMTALGNEFYAIEREIKGVTGLEPDGKRDVEIRDGWIVTGRLVYKHKIGEEETIKIFRLDDNKFREQTQYTPSLMPNFNGDGTRLSHANRSDIVHETVVELYPDKFMAADSHRGGFSLCRVEDLNSYKKEQKCYNWRKSR